MVITQKQHEFPDIYFQCFIIKILIYYFIIA